MCDQCSAILCSHCGNHASIVYNVHTCLAKVLVLVWREIDDELMNNSIVVADSRAGVEKESGDVVLSRVSNLYLSLVHSLA